MERLSQESAPASNASSVCVQSTTSAAGPARKTRPSTVIFPVVLFAVWLAARPSAATPPCEDEPDAKYSRLSGAADVLRVPPSPARLCDIEPTLHATAVVEQRSVSIHCDTSPCKLDDSAALDPAAMYLLRDAAGQALFARGGEQLKWGVSRPSSPETQPVTVQRLRLGPSTSLIERPELFIHGRRCFSLPPDQRLEPDGVYLATHVGRRPVVVIASLPGSEDKPVAPAFTIERDEVSHACNDHGLLWFVPKQPGPDAWFVWNVYARDGETRIVGPLLGPVPWVYASERPRAPPAWALELGREYVLSARAMDLSGNLSDEQRLSFEMERTGRSMYTRLRYIITGAAVLAAAVIALALLATIRLVAKVARTRRDRRDPTRVGPPRPDPAHDPTARPRPPDPG
ncbi:hypothetical protein BE11_18135 [Sorangium cellulosum]|nr:hypothetical protein BE11_18135 [Sorangium cellulosum]